VQKANSGHPGMPMGMADIATVLWKDFLRFNPNNPHWDNRDRFVISNGHGSMLLYALLHLTGYDLPLSEIKNFRQLHSKTPGHPEFGVTQGVETTTGPLGQGLANAVGFSIAEQIMRQTFNRPNYPIVDHQIYCFVGDGCLMEGISHEVCSLAGTLGLGKLIVIYDDNGISIDGPVNTWFGDDTPKRFEAYNWHVIKAVDGHDTVAIQKALTEARANTTQPSLICCKTVIGYGAPNAAGKEDCHGAPLGEAEVALVRKALNWPHAPFVIPDEIYKAWDAREAGTQRETEWIALFQEYQKAYPTLAKDYLRRKAKELPENWSDVMHSLLLQADKASKTMATRKASQVVLEAMSEILPELVGGSADLSGSNLTLHAHSKIITQDSKQGNYLHYGVREFGMAGIMNGLSLYGGLLPYGGTFLVFLDYMRSAVRLSALMEQNVLYVFSHDSIGLGEDGPTHQPVEHLTMLRATPNIHVWRPCDEAETVVAWQKGIERKNGPTCLVTSRQNLPGNVRSKSTLANIARGGYILLESQKSPDAILIGTGSEISLCIQAAKKLQEENIAVRVVSMPCCEVFEAEEAIYHTLVLPPHVPRIAVEAGASLGWHRYVGLSGKIIGLDRFGGSAPASQLFKYFGFTVEHIVSEVKMVLKDTVTSLALE
ncbi:MAG TPA: transketolase, partial [Gammaproteobacteria bacterium]|nr:transketolase [Gammaproteobacteria bacterium]